MRSVSILLPNASVRRVFWFFLALELLVVFLDVFVNHFAWVPVRSIQRMVNITREDSLGTWLSSTQMLVVGMVLVLIGWAVRTEAERFSARAVSWFILAGFFIYMGIDDAIKFHERVGTAFKVLASSQSGDSVEGVLSFFPSYTWQLVFGPFFMAMGCFIVWFVWRELGNTRYVVYVVIAIGLYVLAVMLDFVEGLDAPPYEIFADWFSTSVKSIRHFSKVIEEFLELFGTTWFLAAFMGHLFTSFPTWEIKVQATARACP